jgi:hypothetical protein
MKRIFCAFWKKNQYVIQHCHQKLKLIYSNKVEKEEVGCWSMDWINLAQDRGRWQAFVNAVIYL